jgi:two-component system response regulator
MKPVVLHIEDDANDALLVNIAFRKLDLAAQLRSVDDEHKARAYLSGAPPYHNRSENPAPAFVFLDLKLKGASGFDLLSWIRSQPSLLHLPVIVLSSSARNEDISQAYKLGANSYIAKPSALEDIMDMVRTAHRFWAHYNQSLPVA